MRKIIKIDESKCDGCGLCAKACHEGAIEIVNGKAKLTSDTYCDGLGDCLGECPRGAISFETREAGAYDAEAVRARKSQNAHAFHGCPGAMARTLKAPSAKPAAAPSSEQPSELANWPVQLKLAPVNAPWLAGAHLLIAADCTAFACPNFHRDLLAGKVCLVGCPKLDETAQYVEKLAQMISANDITKIDVAYMEVPCCGGLVRLVQEAIDKSGAPVTLSLTKLSLEGKFMETRTVYPK